MMWSCRALAELTFQLAIRMVQTEKDVPHPQDAEAFGLLTEK